MPKVEQKIRTRKGCLFYVLACAFGVPLLLVILFVGFLGFRDISAKSKLEARIEALQADGKPYDSESMAGYYESLTSSADTQAWEEILEQLNSKEFQESTRGIPILSADAEVPFDENVAWESEDSTRQFIDKWGSLHDRIMRISINAQPVRFPIEWNSIETLLPQAQSMRTAARLLQLRGQVALRDRDSAALRRALDALLGCSEVLSGDPVLVAQLVSVAIDSIGLNLLKDGLEKGLLREQDLEYLLPKYLEKTNLGPQWQYSMHGERGMMLPIFRGGKEREQIRGSLGPGMPPIVTSLPFRSRDANTYMDIIDQAIAFETDDIDTFAKNLDALEAEMEERLGSGNVFAVFDSALTGLLTPALSAAGNAFIRQATQHRIASLSIATRLYYVQNEKFPESLEDLSVYGLDPASLRPLGQKPFGYRIDEQGALLWSFSRNSEEQVVPDEPPTIDDTQPYSEQVKMWLWRIAPSAEADES